MQIRYTCYCLNKDSSSDSGIAQCDDKYNPPFDKTCPKHEHISTEFRKHTPSVDTKSDDERDENKDTHESLKSLPSVMNGKGQPMDHMCVINVTHHIRGKAA
jgi:hypothetical protein